ncbi:Chaperonin-like RbcX protein [Forsythia ovata]|uniref:Chaperonin-like RbcX protein n=1 Tax=Forsythia ovata TaxID=205694 RepID=A0ABD1VK46_9LAMI
MFGAILVSSFTDNLSCPFLCLDSLSSSNLNVKGNLELGLYKNFRGREHLKRVKKTVNLSSSFLDAWYEWRLSAKMLSFYTANGYSRNKRRLQGFSVVDELGGQYEDTFNDVKMEIINCFTFKAVRTVLEQLYEMNPPQYTWFNNFVADNVPNNGKRFLQTLAKERRELAERVMITRLSLYAKWIKKCDHAEIYKEISDENLKLMRERLMETIIWPSDDTNTEKTD